MGAMMRPVRALGYGSFVPVCVYSGAPGWDFRPLAKTPTLAHGYASDHLSSRDAVTTQLHSFCSEQL